MTPLTRPARTPLRPLLRAFFVLGALLFASLAGLAPAAAATHHVTIATYAYSPNPLSINAGDIVTWTNTDSVGHDITVASGPTTFQSPLLSKGQSWSYTFTSSGTYAYICSIHPDMKATVSVAAAAAPAAPAASAAITTVSTPHPTMGMRVVTVPAHSPLKTKAQPTASIAPSAASTLNANSTSNQPTLNPLLLVAGASIGIVVFCLLLLGSRPIRNHPEAE